VRLTALAVTPRAHCRAPAYVAGDVCVKDRSSTNLNGQRRPRYFCSSKLIPPPFNLSPASPEMSRILAISAKGDLEITLSKPEDLERAMPLIKRSYENS
jgi:hypothetical protein